MSCESPQTPTRRQLNRRDKLLRTSTDLKLMLGFGMACVDAYTCSSTKGDGRRSEHRGKFGEQRKKELGVRRRPQRQGKFLSEATSSRGPAEQLLPPACMLLDIDCTETPLRDQSKHRRRSHCELGSSRGSAGQVLPPACMLLSIESPRAHTHCRLNRRGTTLRGEHGSSGRSAGQACE